MKIQLEVTRDGGIRMLHDDVIDLAELGRPKVVRASHVEFHDGDVSSSELPRGGRGLRVGWYVQSAKTLVVLKSGMKTRQEALAWEKKYYSPRGKGWTELTKEA